MVRALLALFLVALPAGVIAATPPPAPTFERARDGGVIDGRIVDIDFRQSRLSVDARGRGKVDVDVLPSTSIQATGGGYHAITDLRRGERVEIWSSLVAGRYVAQIIRVH
jgi:hypothetical protein